MNIILSWNTDVTNLLSTRVDVFECVAIQYFLAIQRARKYYHLEEDTITLYTDKVGSSLFKGVCNTTSLVDKDTYHYLLSEAKIEAMSHQTKPFIHIDGDVFLEQRLKYFPQTKVLLDHDDSPIKETYYQRPVRMFEALGLNYPSPRKLTCMGICGFLDVDEFYAYVAMYAKYKWAYLKNRERFSPLDSMVVVEQYPMALLIEERKWPYEFAEKRNKYTHLYGRQKFYQKNMDWIIKEASTYPEWVEFKSRLDGIDKNNLVFRHQTSFE